MPDAFRFVARSAALAIGLSLFVAAAAAAQPPLAEPPTTPQFMPRYDFHLSAAGLLVDDDRFTWDTHFGGNFDLVDYVHGRAIFLADYQALLGSEFRPFDPNQGNYTLEAASSGRLGKTEFVGVLHHISRHLGDRPKRIAIAWNELDLRVLRQFAAGSSSTVDVRLEAGKVIARAFVDYSWTGGAEVTVRHAVNPHVGVFGRGAGQVIGVIDPSSVSRFVASRELQKGGRVEAGLRLTGQSGALELFAGAERVIDADPFDGLTREWAFWGFRILSK